MQVDQWSELCQMKTVLEEQNTEETLCKNKGCNLKIVQGPKKELCLKTDQVTLTPKLKL